MNIPNGRDQTLLPALLVVVLAALVAFQLTLPAEDALQVEAGRVVMPAIAPVIMERQVADPVIMARAVFTPVAAAGTNGATVPAGPLGDAAPVGVARGHGFARVILQRSDGSIVSVGLGGRYGVWRLVGIGRDAVQFANESGTIRIPLSGRTVSNGPYGQSRAGEE
ncbi:MAG: hypothetical protein K2P68_11410 [Sphingomonas sp.]|nr:hypothetical protein [Sphingomonas sp.]